MNVHPRYQLAILSLAATGLAFSFVDPPFLRDQTLQHVPTVLGLVLLAIAARKRALSDAAMTCVVAFLALHILGARYVYTFVPYSEWIQGVVGLELTPERNHYDRFAHTCFGVLAMPPLVEVLRRRLRLGLCASLAGAVSAVLAISAVYEVFEWGLTIVVSPARAEAYNGQQGDMWDAQKDMALAGVGALTGGLVAALRRDPRTATTRTG